MCFLLIHDCFKTVIPLIIKPGFLSRQYIDGKRTRFIPPMRLYIFITFIFFLLNTYGPKLESQKQIELMTGVNDSIASLFKGSMDYSEEEQKELDAEFENNIVFKKYNQLHQEGKLIPFIQDFVNGFSTLLFVLMPLFAVWLKLLYIRRQEFFMVEHFVFTIHFHAFAFLLAMFGSIFRNSPIWTLFFIAILAIYGYMAMLHFYQQSKLKTLIKAVFLTVAYGISFAIGLTILMFSKLAQI